MARSRPWMEMFQIDQRSLGFFRIGLALLVLTDLLCRCGDLSAHYTDQGILTRAILYKEVWAGAPFWSLHALFGSGGWILGLFVLHALAAFGMLLGYKLETTSALTWLLTVSLQNRNPLIIYAADRYLCLMLFWAMLIFWGTRKDRAGHKPPQQNLTSLATAGLVLQIAMIYGFSAAHKSGVEWHGEGTAVQYMTQISYFTTPVGQFLNGMPHFAKVLTWSVIWFEALVPVLLFFPWRRAECRLFVALGLFALHVGIAVVMNLWFFSAIGCVAAVGLLPAEFWSACDAFFLRSEVRQPFQPYLPMTEVLEKHLIQDALQNFLIIFASFYSLVWNCVSLPYFSAELRPILKAPAYFLRLEQRWDMFSPYIYKFSGSYLVTGTFPGGETLAIFPRVQSTSDAQELRGRESYGNVRWKSFMGLIYNNAYEQRRKYFVDYLCKSVRNEIGNRPQFVQIYFAREHVAYNRGIIKETSRIMHSQPCL